MSVNQDNNISFLKKRRIPEIPNEHGFLDKKVRTLKGSRTRYIGIITYNKQNIKIFKSQKCSERQNLFMY